MKIRFQADANFNEDIVLGLLRLELLIDFQTADEARLRGVPDDLVLKRAAEEGRILVTHDRRTMPRHFGEFIDHSHSPGVFIIAQNLSVRTAIEELLLIWSTSEKRRFLTKSFWKLPSRLLRQPLTQRISITNIHRSKVYAHLDKKWAHHNCR